MNIKQLQIFFSILILILVAVIYYIFFLHQERLDNYKLQRQVQEMVSITKADDITKESVDLEVALTQITQLINHNQGQLLEISEVKKKAKKKALKIKLQISYLNFIKLLEDLESSNLIVELEKLTINAKNFEFQLQIIGQAEAKDIEPIDLNTQSNPMQSGINTVLQTNKANNITLEYIKTDINKVLQEIAKIAGYSIIIDPLVEGNISLSLYEISIEQALATILKIKNLAKTELNGVIYIHVKKSLPNYLQLKYAKATEFTKLFQAEGVVADPRTNSLIINQTANLKNISNIASKIDVPVKQLQISAKIVVAKQGSLESLGINYHSNVVDKLFFDFGESKSASLGWGVNSINPGTLLDLELQALASEHKSRTIAKPTIFTLDKQTAVIESGQDIPYTTIHRNGATPSTIFKKAAIKLEITPHITPKQQILTELKVSQDRPGAKLNDNISIDTTNISTKVLIEDGQTIVLGGLMQETSIHHSNKVPILGDIPILGKLWQHNSHKVEQNEVLIFITPKIAD